MEKTAQQRGRLNKLRELINRPGRGLKSYIDPEWSKLMTQLQTTDNKIRAIASGEVIDGASPGDDAVSMKQLLKDARTKFNRREYLVVGSLLGRFHKKMDDIIREAKNFKLDFEDVHNKFLFAPLTDNKEKDRDTHLEHLRQLRQRFGEEHPPYFIKEAAVGDIWDMIHNLYSSRGRALTMWEKRYPQKVKALRDGSQSLLNQADGLQASLLSTLKEMATARATNNLNGYLELVEKKIANNKQWVDFDKNFKDYYSKNLKPAIDSASMPGGAATPEPKKELPKEERKELGGQEVATPAGGAPASAAPSSPPSSPPPSGGGAPATDPSQLAPSPEYLRQPTMIPPAPGVPNVQQPAGQAVQTPPPPSESGVIPINEQLQDIQQQQQQQSEPPVKYRVAAEHKQFYTVLESMANENPLVVSAFIRKYARSIQSTDPETAIKLFTISKQLKG